jgi:hypothetical protein
MNIIIRFSHLTGVFIAFEDLRDNVYFSRNRLLYYLNKVNQPLKNNATGQSQSLWLIILLSKTYVQKDTKLPITNVP